MNDLLNGKSSSNPPDWAAVQRFIEQNPNEIRWVNNYKETVLHYACFANAPMDIVALLLVKHPDSLRAKDRYGWLPLHVACRWNQSVAVIQMLVQAYPDALYYTENNCRTPLQWAKHCNNSRIVACLETLIADSVKTRQSEMRIVAMIDKKLDTLVDKLKEVNETTLSTLTAEIKKHNETKLSDLVAELMIGNENTLSTQTTNMKTIDLEKEVNASHENSVTADLTEEFKTINKDLSDMIATLNAKNKVLEVELKTTKVFCSLFCFMMLLVCSITSTIFWNLSTSTTTTTTTNSIAMINDIALLDIYNTNTISFSTFLVTMYAKHFVMWMWLLSLCVFTLCMFVPTIGTGSDKTIFKSFSVS